ncbi:hypothetical protein MRB53_018358 [Persea americana]|uniref:Uncharacterized protein n=1 Tax=Persea americana TaxID=3435 RepID=A0ACC2M7J0_PERAE|nr:hypothetical protein MRB53_018358 [Persea americana]|eukprot:TRINITY_DN21653_c0_g1_i1.p1 TRINITY_DN21653_c0_g1~~TRINITY_DN21653_c0_g1_i1.p1  ORF type:complete len:327 (-),score=31.34 TRINITY_DN21653_c0_g1_i1:154-1134(-)
MEIPLMNTITGFEAGITRLKDPSLFSRFVEFSEFLKLHSFWTWGALVLAAVATFSSILHRTKIAFFRLGSRDSAISDPLVRFEDDPDDESCSVSSESDCDDPPSTSEVSSFVGDEDFRLLGSIKSDKDRRKNRNLDLLKGSSAFYEEEDDDCFSGGIVKLWNEIGFGFERSIGRNSMRDLNREEILRSFVAGRSQVPATTTPSPVVVVSAGVAGMRIWDARVWSQTPAAAADWLTLRRCIVGVDSGEVGKVCVREHGGSVVVRDMRNLASPLEEITESDEQTWFDADAVIVGNGMGMGFDDELTEKCWGPPSVMSRCCNVMRSYLF